MTTSDAPAGCPNCGCTEPPHTYQPQGLTLTYASCVECGYEETWRPDDPSRRQEP